MNNDYTINFNQNYKFQRVNFLNSVIKNNVFTNQMLEHLLSFKNTIFQIC